MQFAVGTYTRGFDAEGIYLLEAEPDGSNVRIRLAAEVENPSWLVRHPSRPMLYATIETADNGSGGVAVVELDESGSMTVRDEFSSMGADPCHLLIAVDRLIASNYSGGSVAAWPLDDAGSPQPMESMVQHNGSSVDPVRQTAAHVHSSAFHSKSQTVFVCDLGVDKVYRYGFSEAGIDIMSRKTVPLRPGAGPRMMAIDPEDRFGFVINELDNTIVSFDLDAGPRPVELHTCSTLPDDFTDASYCAHIAMSRDGEHLYASNRGHDSIAVFSVKGEGKLELIQHVSSGGEHPRFFTLTPDETHLWCANRDSDNIVVFARDGSSGLLTETGTVIDLPAPVSLVALD